MEENLARNMSARCTVYRESNGALISISAIRKGSCTSLQRPIRGRVLRRGYISLDFFKLKVNLKFKITKIQTDALHFVPSSIIDTWVVYFCNLISVPVCTHFPFLDVPGFPLLVHCYESIKF